MRDKGIRCNADIRNEKIGYKIREARNARNAYICVIREKEVGDNTLQVRSVKEGELGAINTDEFILKLLEEIRSKAV